MRRGFVRRAGWSATAVLVVFGSTFVAACAAQVSGTVAGVAASGTTTPVGLTVDGLARTYRLYVPASVPASPSLVMVLHGAGGDAKGMEKISGFDAEADARGFVVAYGDGIDRTWNAWLCCGGARAKNVNDVKFLRAVIDDAVARQHVDRTHVFVTGHSNGALMSYRFASEAGDAVRAIAPVAGTFNMKSSPVARVSVLHLHGLMDTSIPFSGSPFLTPVMTGLTRWASVDGCAPTATVSRAGTLQTTSWSGCQNGAQVRLITDDNLGHWWPGGTRLIGMPPVTPVELQATPTIGAFFASVS